MFQLNVSVPVIKGGGGGEDNKLVKVTYTRTCNLVPLHNLFNSYIAIQADEYIFYLFI